MRLSALVHLELELGMRRCELLEEGVERGSVVAGEQRQQPARLGQKIREHGMHDLVERLAARDRLAVRQPEPLALANRDAVQADVAARRR